MSQKDSIPIEMKNKMNDRFIKAVVCILFSYEVKKTPGRFFCSN